MDGRGRALDNVFIERLWRTVKYEDIYLRDYADGWEAEEGLRRYFQFYSERRIHQSLGYRTPLSVYQEGGCRRMRVIRKDEGDPLEASKNTSKCFDSLESEPSRR